MFSRKVAAVFFPHTFYTEFERDFIQNLNGIFRKLSWINNV